MMPAHDLGRLSAAVVPDTYRALGHVPRELVSESQHWGQAICFPKFADSWGEAATAEDLLRPGGAPQAIGARPEMGRMPLAWL